ncbi:MAG: amidohydrolase family protein [Candidatus Kariarchaeaceae archaeon]|jgi:predicted TIM-barrel fold metal-dependent hydrolase
MSRIDQWIIPDKIYDAHCHYFDYSTLERFASTRGYATVDEFINNFNFKNMKFEIPPKNPKKLADRWILELNNKGCDKAVLFPETNKIDSVQVAVEEYPDRFIPYLMFNPTVENAMDILEDAISRIGIKGIKLYPPGNYFYAYEDRIIPFYEVAQDNQLLITFHYGISVGNTADMRYMNPSDLSPIARDFPKINFLMAHFATGYLRELLFLMYHIPNVYAETSSSNAWMKYLPFDISLAQVFQKVIDARGVDHLIFGTDSSFLPRGWRKPILDLQLAVCNTLELNQEQIDMIFYKNLKNLMKL